MPPDRSEHPAAYACRLYNDRLTRSGSPLRWVLRPGGGMGLTSLDRRSDTASASGANPGDSR